MAKNNRLPKNYEEILQELSPENRLYVEKFLETPNGAQKGYKSAVFRFVEYFNPVPIEQIVPKEIENYFSMLHGAPAYIETVTQYLIFFLRLVPLHEQNVACLSEIANKIRREKKNKEPIGLDEVIAFHNILISDKKNQNALFVFELLYIYGLGWSDFKNITEQDFLSSTGQLKTKSKGKINLPNGLCELLNERPDILEPKSYATLATYLRDASLIFGKSVTETVIGETRKKYFPTCQRCNNQYPNSFEHWALVECKNDSYHNKWLLCLSCAKEVGG